MNARGLVKVLLNHSQPIEMTKDGWVYMVPLSDGKVLLVWADEHKRAHKFEVCSQTQTPPRVVVENDAGKPRVTAEVT